MKKYLFPLIAGLGLAVSARAALVLNESFVYADGSLITNSAFVWTNHSGTVGQMQVSSGKAQVSQAQSEDVNAALTGAPYSGPTLYASFVINLSVLPTGNGNYFAHFKDNGTANFKARVRVATTNVTSGFFRIGIGNSSDVATFVPRDLSLNTDYVIVIRYNTAGGTSATTLWINPSSEGSITDRADPSDANAAVGITTFALRQSTATGNGMGVLTLDDLKVGTAFADVTSGGSSAMNPPFVSSIANQNIPKNGATPAVPFYVTDGESAHSSLAVAPTASSNPVLVPLGNISIAGNTDSNRTVTVTPATGQQGFSEITVTCTDGDNNTATRNFLVIVGAPTMSTFTNVEIAHDTATVAIPFTVGDTEGDPITITATSTNETLIPLSGIVFGSSGGSSNITITPTAGLNGLSRITVLATDGFNTVSNSFVITVYPTPGPIFSDNFTYPDGALTSSSGFIWNNHSGTINQVQELGGQIYLTGANSEDVSAFLGINSYPPHQGWILYGSFTVKFSVRPTASGDYFAHFKATGSSSFACKVFSVTNGAAPGKLRLGLSNSGNAPSVIWPGDLDLNTTYTVVTRMNVGTGASRLWVSPASESSTSVTAVDSAFPFEVFTYAFRQTSGIGDMAIDDFKCSTSFSDVVEVRPTLTITATGNNVTISWPADAVGYVLRYTDEFPTVGSPVGADYSDQGTVQGNLKVVTINGVTGNRFFQLQKP